MSVLTLFGIQILIFAVFPFFMATLRKGLRAAGFYIIISIYLLIGGFLGSIYSLPVTETITISGGNLAYGALMATAVLFVLIEKDISVLRNVIRLVFWVNVFKVLFFTTISWALQNEAVLNPNNTAFAVFRSSVLFTILGGALIILELFLFVLIFEQLKKRISNIFVLAILYNLVFVLVLCLDGVLFPAIAFTFNPQLVAIVIGGVRGKLFMATAYSIPILIFLVVFHKRLTEFVDLPLLLKDLWSAPKEALIEEIQHKQQELEKSEKNYRTLFEESTVGIMVLNEQNIPIDVNKRACEILGYNSAELLSINAASLIHEEDLESKDHHAAMEHLRKGESTQVEYRLRKKDGDYVPVELSTKILDEGRFLNVLRDISERKRIENALRDTQAFNVKMLNTSPDVVYVYDIVDQVNIYSNVSIATVLGYSVDDIQSMGNTIVKDLMHPDDFQTYAAEVVPKYQVAADDDLIEHQYRMRHKNGEWRWLLSRESIFLRQAHGSPRQIFGLLTDITERVQATDKLAQQQEELELTIAKRTRALADQVAEREELNDALGNLLEDFQSAYVSLENTTNQLYDANAELKAFTYSVSHDLRAPLRAVDGFSQILLEDYGDQIPEAAVRYLDKISEGAQHMGQLITDLLALSRLGRQEFQKKHIEPALIVEQVLKELESEMAGHEIEIEVGKLPACLGDAPLIKQVYINLIGNAIKFTAQSKDAAIQIGWGDVGDEKAYYVKDNGVGFDMEYADKLFDVFQRLHSVEHFEGTGVGLAIVKRIIRRHGGRVWADAETDKGSVFYFTLPEENEV
ncbi:MAG: PAS domain S-box protein [Anaerolineales bacterium]|nr:PAS domain S-box protein [Anaerolineales bacterium]